MFPRVTVKTGQGIVVNMALVAKVFILYRIVGMSAIMRRNTNNTINLAKKIDTTVELTIALAIDADNKVVARIMVAGMINKHAGPLLEMASWTKIIINLTE
jgi:hypothetical protein